MTPLVTSPAAMHCRARDGVRESTQSWREVLLDRKRRGLKQDPKLAIGDGALGFWSALREVFATTEEQRCWGEGRPGNAPVARFRPERAEPRHARS